MTFLLVFIGSIMALLDVFVWPDLFHFTVILDLAMIWILFSWDIQEEESIFAFFSILFVKTLFMPHAIVVPYIISMGIFYSLYYFLLPLFFRKEAWLSFLLCILLLFVLGKFLYRINGKVLFYSLLIQTLFYFLLFPLRRLLKRYHQVMQNNFSVSV